MAPQRANGKFQLTKNGLIWRPLQLFKKILDFHIQHYNWEKKRFINLLGAFCRSIMFFFWGVYRNFDLKSRFSILFTHYSLVKKYHKSTFLVKFWVYNIENSYLSISTTYQSSKMTKPFFLHRSHPAGSRKFIWKFTTATSYCFDR